MSEGSLKSDELANGSMRSRISIRVIHDRRPPFLLCGDFAPLAGRLGEHVADASLKDLMEIQTCLWLRLGSACDS